MSGRLRKWDSRSALIILMPSYKTRKSLEKFGNSEISYASNGTNSPYFAGLQATEFDAQRGPVVVSIE